MTEVFSEFRLKSLSVTPDLITKRIKINPTRIWNIGESLGITIVKAKENAWILSIKNKNVLFLEDEFKSLYSKIQPKLSGINKLLKDYNLTAEFFFAVYVKDNDAPSMHFSKSSIEKIALLNAELDIDFYTLKD